MATAVTTPAPGLRLAVVRIQGFRSIELAVQVGIEVDTSVLLDPTSSAEAVGASLAQLTAALSNADHNDDGERLLRDADTLNTCWRSFCRAMPADDRTLSSFLNHLSLAGRGSPTDPGIRVLTIHAVKGLEFRAVFLVGMNEGTFPDYRNLDDRSIEDERRNAYVAVTRAGRFLQLSRPRVREMPWGDLRVQRPSRFLAELGI